MPLPSPSKFFLGTAVGLGSLAGLGWLGLQGEPAPFPPYPATSQQRGFVPLPAGLPPPVTRYLAAAVGEQAPSIESAVLTGRGQLRLFGVTFPARMRFTLAAGEAYRHYIECTWFGLPIMKINETYLDGQLRQELPVGVVASEPKADLAANLALWGEQAVWMPSVLATDPRLRWEAIGGDTARLTIPFGETEDNFTVRFDEQSGLVQSMEALRFREPKDEQKVPWRIDLLRWETFDRVRVPSTFAITWLDRGTPWLTATIEDVVYNVDVSQYIRASGP